MAVFPAGHILTSADLDTLFPTGVGALTSYTPVIVQGATPTLSVEYAAWFKTGRKVTVYLSCALTGAGTAANVVTCTFPAAAGTLVNYRQVGTGGIYDASANTYYAGIALWSSATTFRIQPHAAASSLGAASFTAALAAGDLFFATLEYYTLT